MIEYEFVDANLLFRNIIAEINYFMYDFIVKLSKIFPGLKYE